MIFCSYCTEKTPYMTVMEENLLPSLKKWNLPYDISYVKDFGSWSLNTAYKSTLIKEMLLKHKEPVTFIDCDATIEKFPQLLFEIPKDIDLAYLHFSWWGHWRGIWDKSDEKLELLSGTMYWAYNEKVLKLLDEWIKAVQSNIQMWEQKTLEAIVNAHTDLNIYNLPYEYCCVLMQDNSIPKYIKEPVIIHHQASRRFKRWWQNQRKGLI